MVIGGPLSGWLMDVGNNLGVVNWQWLFIVEGLMSVVVGVAALFYLVDGPEKASWFNPEERNVLLQSLCNESAEKEKHGPSTFLSALKNARVLYFSLIFFVIQMSVYGVVFFLPTRFAETMRTNVGLTVGMVTAIPWICAVIVTRVVTLYADRTGWHRPLAAIMLAVAAIGIMASTFSDNPYWVVTSGFVAVQPLFWTQPANYLSGAAAAGGIALINCIGNFGGFVAPSIKTYAESAASSAHAGMYLLSIIGLITAPVIFICYRRHQESR
jgi:MFS family permease